MANVLPNVILTIVSNKSGDKSHIHIVTGWNDIVMLAFNCQLVLNKTHH